MPRADPAVRRLVVTAGGEPTPRQLAALAVVLAPTRRREPADGAAEDAANRPRRDVWLRAARLEAVGAGRCASPDDVSAGAARRAWR